jgi:hypothetical protein
VDDEIQLDQIENQLRKIQIEQMVVNKKCDNCNSEIWEDVFFCPDGTAYLGGSQVLKIIISSNTFLKFRELISTFPIAS